MDGEDELHCLPISADDNKPVWYTYKSTFGRRAKSRAHPASRGQRRAEHSPLKPTEKDKMKAAKKRQRMHRREEDSALQSANNANDQDNESVDLELGGHHPTLDLTAEEGFAKYRDGLISLVPDGVKSQFREGGFCRWGKKWLPVLQLGPFDVEPGPRDMWLDMFEKSQKHGRELKRLVYWYGTQWEDRGQAYSFVSETQLINYNEGRQKGFCNLPNNIQNKIAKERELSNKEARLKRGLLDIEADMQRDKAKRANWMMQFKEDYDAFEERSIVATAKKLKTNDEDAMSKGKSKSGSSKDSKKKSISKPSLLAIPLPDGVVSSSTTINFNVAIGSSKRASPVSSSLTHVAEMRSNACRRAANQKKRVKVEPTASSSIPMCKEAKPQTGVRQPTPEECCLVVQELGKLHPDVIEMNEQRREMFALRRQQVETESKQNGKLGNNTPVTDAIISTMLSQNTTAANQNRAFASLKKAYPGGWTQVANETNISRIEDAIRVAGLAQVRAERMQSMLQTVQDERGEANFEFLQHVQSNDDIIAELSRHKGMGPKTISCVLLFALGKPDFPVDTHVLRISKQMGWVSQSSSREGAYAYLNDRVPDESKLDLHCLLVTHGKQCNKCAARGKAQFPPKEQWVCPMAAIKSGKLAVTADKSTKSTADDMKLAIVKKEDNLEPTKVKVEKVSSGGVAVVKLEQLEQDGRLFRC